MISAFNLSVYIVMCYKIMTPFFDLLSFKNISLLNLFLLSWVKFGGFNSAKWYTKLNPCCYAHISRTNSKHLTKLTFTNQFKAKHVMMYTNHVWQTVCVWVYACSAYREAFGQKTLDCSCWRYHSSKLSFLCLETQNRSKNELQDCGDVHGDWLLCGLCFWMDPGLFHHAHRDLDLVWSGQHSIDHFKLLLQPMEGLHIWFNWSIWLQRNSIDACTELLVQCI